MMNLPNLMGRVAPRWLLAASLLFDRIANMGLRYTQFHSTALCSPTRASQREYKEAI
jgi:arylsulfatase A-like enzyme